MGGGFALNTERAAAIDYFTMGQRIRARRRELGLTQEKLAERVDISPSFVGHLERGEKIPSLDTVARLCTAMDVSMDYLALGRRQACDKEKCELYEELKNLMNAFSQG